MSEVSDRVIVLAGGGTGGHVYPLIALAEAITEMAPEILLHFVGGTRGLENNIIPDRGWPLHTLSSEPLKGRDVSGVFSGVGAATKSVWQARKLLKTLNPQAVISVGGYAAGPVALAAVTKKIPMVLVEPNATLGMTQRWLLKFAKRVYVGFPELEHSIGQKARFLGTPLRKGFEPFPSPRRVDNAVIRLLVVGGSQGAEFFNKIMPEVVRQWIAETPGLRLSVVHQVGQGRVQEVTDRYKSLLLYEEMTKNIEVHEFIDDMPQKIAQSHLVIARAGALTCAEVCAVGRPALFVPYPHAADDHQGKNADALAQAGAAVVVRQEDAQVKTLVEKIRQIVAHEDQRRKMAQAALSRGMPHAAERVIEDMFDLLHFPYKKRVQNGNGASSTKLKISKGA